MVSTYGLEADQRREWSGSQDVSPDERLLWFLRRTLSRTLPDLVSGLSRICARTQ